VVTGPADSRARHSAARFAPVIPTRLLRSDRTRRLAGFSGYQSGRRMTKVDARQVRGACAAELALVPALARQTGTRGTGTRRAGSGELAQESRLMKGSRYGGALRD
jgi:hypothetical protein